MGHFLRPCITGCTSCRSQILYLPGNLPMDLMDWTAAWTVAGLVAAAVGEAGAGHWDFCARSHDCDGTIHLHDC